MKIPMKLRTLVFITVGCAIADSYAIAQRSKPPARSPKPRLQVPKPTMLKKGKSIFEKNFDNQNEVDSIDLRKHTKGSVKNGVMVTIPPFVHGEAPKGAKFAKEEFVRSHFKLGEQDYVFSFRVKFLELDRKVGQKICFIDVGHRWIRLEMTPGGSQLVFQNYILGERGRKKTMVESKALQLKYGEWYEGTIEISGDEILFNINGVMFHVKNDLVAKKRETVLAQRFCLDLRGVGYHLDYAAAWKTNGFQETWNEKRAELKKQTESDLLKDSPKKSTLKML